MNHDEFVRERIKQIEHALTQLLENHTERAYGYSSAPLLEELEKLREELDSLQEVTK